MRNPPARRLSPFRQPADNARALVDREPGAKASVAVDISPPRQWWWPRPAGEISKGSFGFHPRLCTAALRWRGCRNRRTLDEPFGDFAPSRKSLHNGCREIPRRGDFRRSGSRRVMLSDPPSGIRPIEIVTSATDAAKTPSKETFAVPAAGTLRCPTRSNRAGLPPGASDGD